MQELFLINILYYRTKDSYKIYTTNSELFETLTNLEDKWLPDIFFDKCTYLEDEDDRTDCKFDVLNEGSVDEVVYPYVLLGEVDIYSE